MIGRHVGEDLARAGSLLRERGIGIGAPLYLLPSTESTNDDARGGLRSGEPHGATWLAEEQSKGRGRQGRTWTAPRGEGLLFSTLFRVSAPASRLPPVSLAAGLAVQRGLVRAGVEGARLKWPNDVVVEREGNLRKLAGVLVEAPIAGGKVEAIVVGVGINVHTRRFPPELVDVATSVGLELARGQGPQDLRATEALNRAEVLAAVLEELDRTLELVLHRGLGLVRAALDRADVLFGKPVRSESGEGTAAGIDDGGALLVRTAEGVLARWNAGEVHLTAAR